MMMSFPISLPPILPRLSNQIPLYDKDKDLTQHLIPSISLNQNQNIRQRRNSHDNKLISEIDRQEFELQQRVFKGLSDENMRIAIHGQTWLRPPGMEPWTSPGYYGDQEQQEITLPDETFLQDEDEEGFVLSEEEDVDEYEDEEGLEEEEQDLDADIEEAPSDASYSSASPTNAATPTTRTHAQEMYEVTTPPSPGPRARTEIQAFDDLMSMMAQGRDVVVESEMNVEEPEEEEEEEEEGEVDLDAEVEDMDDELESSIFEGDSMEL